MYARFKEAGDGFQNEANEGDEQSEEDEPSKHWTIFNSLKVARDALNYYGYLTEECSRAI